MATSFNLVNFPGPLVLGTPPALLLGRVLLGGFVTALCFSFVPIGPLYVFALAFDLAGTALAGGVVTIRTLPAQALLVAIYFIPAQLFARWTRENRNLRTRAWLHPVFYAGLLLGVLPALILACGGGTWSVPFARSSFLNKLYLQMLFVPAILLLHSVQEFARRGYGTPMPADPPERLVTSGIYAYVANPMQIGKFLAVAGWGWFWWNPWIVAAALAGLAYSVGIASPREEREMAQRFPKAWPMYRQEVGRWRVRWKPYHASLASGTPLARLYLRLECAPCRQMAEWIGRQAPVGLQVLPIEPERMLSRITYDPGDGGEIEYGIAGVARALEHIHFGLAMIAGMLRLPGIAWLAQVVTDALNPENQVSCAIPEADSSR